MFEGKSMSDIVQDLARHGGVRALIAALPMLCSCAPSATDDVKENATGQEPGALTGGSVASVGPIPAGCGYEISWEVTRISADRYAGWVRLTNASADAGRDFRVLLDLADSRLGQVDGGRAEKIDGGYALTAPASLRRRPLRPGASHRIDFVGRGQPGAVNAYLLSINGTACDETAPALELAANRRLFTAPGTLELTAVVSDEVAVSRVEFYLDGEFIGARSRAPYTLSTSISAANNGRRRFTAAAFDVSGNEALDDLSVLAAVGTRTVGSSVGQASDYVDFPPEFAQITPENAGKWGSVEATRDVMDWTELDRAYAFAVANEFPFKLHTLVWGQQEPSWISALPPAEQLEEVEEWMRLLAERYPAAGLVDVVNEPLHAPPSFKGALGGDGATGWDWVIRAFELARDHFPDSELVLNEYQTLMTDPFTDDFLKIIALLDERELIDGVGEQAHYLERTELATVQSKLDRLAATGLPIYISEFDVNIANDAHQANRVRDLFSLFWSQPSVLGVTFWGYRQGNTWRPDAYLVRSDGSRRPAFEWLACFLAGRSDCNVPEYLPEPRLGTERGVTVEAEEYDTASGVDALGNVIAYIDDGDWASYGRIAFQEGWSAFSVTYSKGNDAPGSVTVHLDSLEAAPLLAIDLPPTGGWGASATIEVPWEPLAGSHAVFVRFHGVAGQGVANLDRIRFGLPTPTGPGSNIIANSDFEDGSSGWFGWGGSLGTSTTRAHGGSQSLVVTGRSAGAGTAAYDVTSGVRPGGSYPVRMFVTVGGATAAPVNITSKVVCAGQGDAYNWVANAPSSDGVWTELVGTLTVPECTLTQVLVYVEGPPAGVDVYVDDASVTAAVP